MSEPLTENFCGHCGVSLIPLPVIHVSVDCSTCGRRKHLVRPGAEGKGIMIEQGDSLNIPAGALTMSFDPSKSPGHLSRDGVPFLLQQFFYSGMPVKPDDLVPKIIAANEVWEAELQASDKLAGIDLQGETGGEKAWDRLKDDRDSYEYHVLSKCLSATITQEAVKAGNAQAAAHAALFMGLQHGLSVVSEPYFQEMLWRGYTAGLAVHESATAADHVPGEVEALAELDPLFKRVGEATLKTWLDSGVTLGPRIGVSRLPEPLLVARAKWHIEEFKREREDTAKAPAERRAWWDTTFKGLQLLGTILGSAAVGALLSYLGLTLK